MTRHFLPGVVLALFAMTAPAGAQVPTKPATKPTGAPKATAPVPQGMTNADVVKMAKAGLGDALIIGAIRQATKHAFTLTPDGLVDLKTAGVSDSVMQVMLDPSATQAPQVASTATAATPASAPAPSPETVAGESGAPAIVAAEAGVYYIAESGPVRLEAKSPYQTRSGSTMVSRLTFGIKAARINTMLQGLRADLQVTTAPKFYIHVSQVLGTSESVGEYYLVRFTPKEAQGRREIEIASNSFFKFQQGFPEKDLFQLETKRIQKDVYLVTPKSALPAGEFGLLQLPQGPAPTPRRIYDFGVR